ncbi:hypothetical protein, partial [Streptococcus pneumoniae]|uniref:hypothetical protein n=1 Tax=Streptococcus pneumoniae TaxID=1313 RepID=UPI000AEE1BCE
LKQELKNIKSKENNYKKVNTVDDVVKIKQINVAIEKEIDRLEKEINDLVDKKTFEKNRIHINDIRKKYEEISRQLSKIDFDILLHHLQYLLFYNYFPYFLYFLIPVL